MHTKPISLLVAVLCAAVFAVLARPVSESPPSEGMPRLPLIETPEADGLGHRVVSIEGPADNGLYTAGDHVELLYWSHTDRRTRLLVEDVRILSMTSQIDNQFYEHSHKLSFSLNPAEFEKFQQAKARGDHIHVCLRRRDDGTLTDFLVDWGDRLHVDPKRSDDDGSSTKFAEWLESLETLPPPTSTDSPAYWVPRPITPDAMKHFDDSGAP